MYSLTIPEARSVQSGHQQDHVSSEGSQEETWVFQLLMAPENPWSSLQLRNSSLGLSVFMAFSLCGSASSPTLQRTFCRPIMGGVCGLPGPLTPPSAFWICSGHLTRPEQALQLGPHTTSFPIACLTPMCAAFSRTWPSPQLCGVKMHHRSWVRFCSFVGPGIFQLFVIE